LTGNDFVTALRAQRIIAILRSNNAEEAVAMGHRLVAAGIGILEVSLNTPGALTAIAELAARTGAVVGAGTVLSADAAHQAADAGARFFVAPILDLDTIEAAHERAMAAVPGCATPSEMLRAHRAGAEAIKVFPATMWTPAGLANVSRAMPFLRLVPTGGIGVDDARAWMSAGATALGMGSSLTPDNVAMLQQAVS
jgi:2-dehydro-3-deoxyphosphogluconate aldolase/(4S)-4-hydroxy-2-oxoglutarate aldolase